MSNLDPVGLTLREAVNAFHRGDFDRATTLFLNVLNIQPDNPDALYFMGMIDHAAGRHEVAEYRAEQLLKQKPEDGKALNLSGTILMSQRKLDDALRQFDRGMKFNPDDPVLKVNAAICNIGLANPSRGIELCRDAINIKQDYINAWNILGNAHMGKGDMDSAAAAFEEALTLKPDFMDARFNLGVALFELKRYEQAEILFDGILSVDPGHVHALTRKADVLMIRDQYQEAGALYQKAAELATNFVPALIGRGRVFLRMDKYNDALSNFRRALILNTDNVEALMNTGSAFRKLGQLEAAQAAFNDVLSIDPGNSQAKFHLASVSGSGAPAKAEADYVRNLFDEFADTFDEQLTRVDYNAPEQLASLVREYTDRDDLVIVDLGCGTGLSGEQFKAMSSQIVGIDLSPRMLKAAADRGIYDELEENDILGGLVRHQNVFDLVVSADTFPYIGDLESVFLSIVSAMKPGALFVFTTERHEGDEDFILGRTARYAHSTGYIRSIAERRGLDMLRCEPTVYRKERDKDVPALIVAMRRQA